MACAIEDAGFEIRDCIQWLYGSGFPKSHNISKAIDKRLGGTPKQGRFLYKNGKTAGGKRIGQLAGGAKHYETIPDTEQARQWDGWGTALKPANEPIVLARKPISEKTIADNVLKWGTGGLNIDRCRVGWKDERDRKNGWRASPSKDDENEYSSFKSGSFGKQNEQGRFPANVILDEEAGRMLDEQSGFSRSSSGGRSTGRNFGQDYDDKSSKNLPRTGYNDSGGASRFFYCAKASKKERGEGNNHPTVKPVSLIKYLVTLVTPPDGVCLDPFMGSGTTAVACKKLNRNYIGFEISKEYCKIANERISKIQPIPSNEKHTPVESSIKETSLLDWLDELLGMKS
jgi:site-specific DNA-methyltransferase (adenine-specific)